MPGRTFGSLKSKAKGSRVAPSTSKSTSQPTSDKDPEEEEDVAANVSKDADMQVVASTSSAPPQTKRVKVEAIRKINEGTRASANIQQQMQKLLTAQPLDQEAAYGNWLEVQERLDVFKLEFPHQCVVLAILCSSFILGADPPSSFAPTCWCIIVTATITDKNTIADITVTVSIFCNCFVLQNIIIQQHLGSDEKIAIFHDVHRSNGKVYVRCTQLLHTHIYLRKKIVFFSAVNSYPNLVKIRRFCGEFG